MLVESMVRPAPSSHWSAENVARFSAASLVVRYSKYSSAVISIENETEASDLGSVVSFFSSLAGSDHEYYSFWATFKREHAAEAARKGTLGS